jgi:RNA:NAD 2'-phosphotransferase (TPT1/KptA family)
VATPDKESTLLDFARAGSAANLERVVRGWKTLDRKSEVTAEQIRHRSRRFSAWVDDDGMVVVRGRLDPEVGAMLMRAVEAASDALYREETGADHDAEAEGDKTTPEQRRADAVGLIAERALAAGFGNGASTGNGDSDAPISGSRAERYQVMLHVDAETLRETGNPGLSELEDGTRVSAAMQSFA